MDQTKIAELAKERHPLPPELAHIPGWGIDAPIERRVGSPREGKFSPSENGATWEVPEQQESDVKVFISTERPGLTPVFGTRQPPKGLSGLIRGYAYTKSEGKRRHWLALMLADRVDVVESFASDLIFYPVEDENAPRKVRRETIFVAAAGLVAVGFLAFNFYQNKRLGEES